MKTRYIITTLFGALAIGLIVGCGSTFAERAAFYRRVADRATNAVQSGSLTNTVNTINNIRSIQPNN